MIALPPGQTSEYVYIPRGLSLGYLQGVLRRALGDSITISGCTAFNLCTGNDERVSDSGATVLHFVLDLSDGRVFQLVAKVLSPDSVNIFKIDRRFEARRWEVALIRWWGKQDIPHIPAIYNTRADASSREYWILYEYFPRVGWSAGRAGTADVVQLAEHIAYLHAYSRQRLEELGSLLDGIAPGDLRTPDLLLDALARAMADGDLVAIAGLSGDELAVLSGCRNVIKHRPAWVDRWDIVCANRDFSASNTAVRDAGGRKQLVSFDWGAAHLGPAEEDFDVLLGRDFATDTDAKENLVRRYLRAYADLTGRSIERDEFVARIPWARLMVTLRYVVEHLNSLKWMRWQSRSVHLIHALIGLAKRTVGGLHGQCRTNE